MSEQWVLLWSHSQQALHVEQIDDMLRNGREAFAADHGCDYIPLFLGTREEIDKAADELTSRVRARYLKRQGRPHVQKVTS